MKKGASSGLRVVRRKLTPFLPFQISNQLTRSMASSNEHLLLAASADFRDLTRTGFEDLNEEDQAKFTKAFDEGHGESSDLRWPYRDDTHYVVARNS
jgi:hypothetical protein